MRWSTAITDKGYFVVISAVEFFLLSLGDLAIFMSKFLFISLGTILILGSFICLTSQIPSRINKRTAKEYRGTANGVFQTFAFLGFSFGPSISGFLQSKNLSSAIVYISLMLSILGMSLILLLEDKSNPAVY